MKLKVSSTVEHEAGELGTFRHRTPGRISPGEISSRPMMVQSDSAASSVPFTCELPTIDGTEETELPSAIVKRVQVGEPDVERILRPRTSSGY